MSKLQTARNLARAHFQAEPHLECVAILEPLREEDPREPIRLVEVVDGTIERGIEPIAFPPNPARGLDYPLWIIELSPNEYRPVRADGKVRFREQEWEIGEEIPRAQSNGIQ
jgi:hypothetical protein